MKKWICNVYIHILPVRIREWASPVATETTLPESAVLPSILYCKMIIAWERKGFAGAPWALMLPPVYMDDDGNN